MTRTLLLIGAAACVAPRAAAPVIENDADPPVVVPLGPFPSLDAYCAAIGSCSPVDLHGARARIGPFDAVVPMQLAGDSASWCVVALEHGSRWFVAPPDGRVCAEEERTRTRRVRVVALDREMVEVDFDVVGFDDRAWDPGYRLSIVCAAHGETVACTPLFQSRCGVAPGSCGPRGQRSWITVEGGVVTVTSRGEPSEGDGVYPLLRP